MRALSLFLLIILSTSLGAQTNKPTLKIPNVSGNALFLYRNSNFSGENQSVERNGVDLQELEIAIYDDVDPYSRLFLLLTVHPEYTADPSNDQTTKEWVIEPEEAYADTNHIPHTNLKIGKFKAAIGKQNLLHTHAFPFVDAPLANQNLLGDEGLNDIGISAAFLLPLPWYSEFTAQHLSGEGENTSFNSPTPSDAVGLANFKNLFDLDDDLTFEAGASYARGKNSLGGNTTLFGVDGTFKWRPAEGGKYHSLLLAGEYLQRQLEQRGTTDEKGVGWNIWGQFQFAERWRGLARFDQLDVSGADFAANPEALQNVKSERYSVSLVFDASEFSIYRLEYNQTEGLISDAGDSVERKFYLQARFTIGAHPTHSY